MRRTAVQTQHQQCRTSGVQRQAPVSIADAPVRQVTASYADGRRRILVANSDGLLTEDDQVLITPGMARISDLKASAGSPPPPASRG